MTKREHDREKGWLDLPEDSRYSLVRNYRREDRAVLEIDPLPL